MDELRDLLLQVRNHLSSSSRQDPFLQMILSAEESLRLLGTNDDPIRTEKFLQKPLKQCQALLLQKEQEKADSHCRRDVLKEEERDLANIAEKIKGLFSYIQRCPPEIISEIFLKCVDFYHESDSEIPFCFYLDNVNCIHLDEAPLLLLRVSKKWRDIALNTPTLFTQLYLSHGMIEGKEEELDSVLRLFLTSSGSLALDVFLHAHRKRSFSSRRMDMVSARLSPYLSRIYRIRMPLEFLSHLFPSGSCTDAPALLDFRLYDHASPPSNSQLGRLAAPKLEVFSCVNPDFNWDGFITFGECLKIFSGHCSVAKLPHLFSSSNLEYCCIFYHTGSPANCDAPIFLPRLQDLSIATSSKTCTPLLPSQLRMPSLRKLHLSNLDYSSHRETMLSGIISSFISERPSLETLIIGGAIIQCEEFHDLLRILPELTDIALHQCEISGALRALIPVYAPDICPKLATLDLRHSWCFYPDSPVDYEQNIIDIICSRACSRLSEDPEETTQRCLREVNLLGAAERFSDVGWKKFQSFGYAYNIDIKLRHEWDGEELDDECEHSDSDCSCMTSDSDF